MNKRVFIVNGSGGVGKDTFVEFVGKQIPVRNYSSVDLVKIYAKRIGWNGEKDEKGRRLLSDLKDALTRYDDIPFKFLKEAVDSFLKDDYYEFCFLHIREPKEIQRAKEEFNAKTILITRNAVEHISSNHADAGVRNYKYDIHLYNDSSLDLLEEMAKNFVKVYSK